MTREEMGARIRELRIAAGISQAAAARHAGIHYVTWQRYESGERNPSSRRIADIARAVDAPVGAIYNPDVAAELTLSPDTRARLAANPTTAAHDLAAQLAPALLATLTAQPTRTRERKAVQALSPVGVAERLVAAKREGLRIAEWQHAQAVRAQAVE